MMPARYLLALPLLAFTADWHPFVVDAHVSVELPAAPTVVNFAKLAPTRKPDHTQLWVLNTPEGSYQVMRLPNSSSIKDEAGRATFYQGMLTSLLRNSQGQLVAATAFATAGGSGVEYEYQGIHKGTGKQVLKYTRCLLLDSVAYSLNFTPANKLDSLGVAGAEQRKRFYNSLTVKP